MFKRIEVTDIKGFRIGNAENTDAGTGCTVIISEKGAVAGVSTRGGAPITAGTDLLRLGSTADRAHAVVLSGGSVYGLEAGSGVMRELEDMGIGNRHGDVVVPVVSQASLDDLSVGRSDIRPDRTMGIRAVHNAFSGIFRKGNRGAGTGAAVGKFYGMARAMKTGLGTFACTDGSVFVGAVTVVNAYADVVDGRMNLVAGLLSADRKRVDGTIRPLKQCVHADSKYLGSINYYEALERARRSESAAVHEPVAGEVKEIESANSSEAEVKEQQADVSMIHSEDIPKTSAPSDKVSAGEPVPGGVSEDVPTADSTADAVMTADSPVPENVKTNEEERIDRIEEDKEKRSEPDKSRPLSDEDAGYNLTFNTTLTCLITNAKLTKAEANELASVLHDGYARSIKPVHSSEDGDVIFVMASGEEAVNFDAFAALATDIVQYSVIDGALSAESAYGLPSASSFRR